MNRWNLVRLVLGAVLGGAPLAPGAQQALEIIPLRHRTAEQVLPALQPLLEPGATLSGARGQLFVRASPANVAELRRALEAIDRPARRLQISVRFEDTIQRDRRALGASGTVGSRAARIEVRAEDSQSAAGERYDQRVQVLEGSRAVFISGQSLVILHEVVTGFAVVPQLTGERAHLEISSVRPGEELVTSISVALRQWTEIGGAMSDRARSARGIASASGAHATAARRVWVMVEELPN